VKRLLTAAIGVPLALFATFRFPSWAFLLLVVALFTGAAAELVAIARAWAPNAPLRALLVLVPVGSAVLWWALRPDAHPRSASLAAVALPVLALGMILALGVGTILLFARTPMSESLPAAGALSFGTPYFVVAAVSLTVLQETDPWLLFLLYAIVWLGDTAAYYAGSRLGRHKMAPEVSPKKSWEGAVAGFLTGILATVVWSLWRRGGVELGLVAVAAATAVAAQIGDLVESMFKRGAGVKDSGSILPGHGGLLDRFDAMFFAAPVLLLGLWCLEGRLSLGLP
jgi:phosphatidate cytidylyltransferase